MKYLGMLALLNEAENFTEFLCDSLGAWLC